MSPTWEAGAADVKLLSALRRVDESSFADGSSRVVLSPRRWVKRRDDSGHLVPPYSAAISSGAMRGKIIWMRVPAPGSESRSSRPPSRLVTML